MSEVDPTKGSSREARVTTRTGDDGFTSLLGPQRVPKYSPRPSAFGTLDEASSTLGLARALSKDQMVRDVCREIQQGLYKLMAELATPVEAYERVHFKMRSADVERLDQLGSELKRRVRIGTDFVMPGDSADGAALDVARTVVRRGERLVARLAHDGEVGNKCVLQWLNRVSDTIFLLARYADAQQTGHPESGAEAES